MSERPTIPNRILLAIESPGGCRVAAYVAEHGGEGVRLKAYHVEQGTHLNRRTVAKALAELVALKVVKPVDSGTGKSVYYVPGDAILCTAYTESDNDFAHAVHKPDEDPVHFEHAIHKTLSDSVHAIHKENGAVCAPHTQNEPAPVSSPARSNRKPFQKEESDTPESSLARDARTRASASVPERDPVPIVVAIAEVCFGLEDAADVPEREMSGVARAADECARRGFTPADVRRLPESWSLRSPPRPSQIVAEVLRARQGSKPTGPKPAGSKPFPTLDRKEHRA